MKVSDYFAQSKINLRFNAFLMQMCDEIDIYDFDLEKQYDLTRIPGMRDKILRAYSKHKYGDIKHTAIHVCKSLEDCGSWAITSGDNPDPRKNDIVAINYCNNRFCALCEMRKSRRKSMRLQYKVQQAIESGEYELFFLTITVPNVSGGFKPAFDGIRKAVKSLFKSYGMSNDYGKGQIGYNAIPGLYGQFETTIAKDGKYHPHLHLMFAIRKSDLIEYKENRQGFCKSLKFYNNKCKTKITEIDNNTVSLDIKHCCRKIDPELFQDTKPDHGRETGYICKLYKCKDLDQIHELTKYLCNLYTIRTKEQFIEYCANSYKLQDTISMGVLGFKESKDMEGFHAWIDARKRTDDDLVAIGQNTKCNTIAIVARKKNKDLFKDRTINVYEIYDTNGFYEFYDDENPWRSILYNVYGSCSPGDTYDQINDSFYEWEKIENILKSKFKFVLNSEFISELTKNICENKIDIKISYKQIEFVS